MKEFFKRILGDIQWTPPDWAGGVRAACSEKARSWRQKLEAKISSDPRKFWIQVGSSVLFLAAVLFARHWYAHRPHPQYLTLSGSAPGATRLEDVLKPDPVSIEFGGSAARLEDIGKPVIRGISMTPAIKGEWVWSTDRQLTFTPKEDWTVGAHFVVRFDQKLFSGHVLLQKYEYRFDSAPLTGQISSSEFYIDPREPKVKQAIATLFFSHPVDAHSLETRISLKTAGAAKGFLGIGAKSYGFSVSYNKYKNEAYIRSTDLEIPRKDMALSLTVDEGVLPARGGSPTTKKMEASISIPGLYTHFTVGSMEPTLVRNEKYEPEQVLVLNLSEGALESEIQKHLEVYVLPKNLPPMQGKPGYPNYHWSDPLIIGPEVLSLSEKLKLDPIPTSREYAPLHSFKYKAEVGRFLYFRITKGAESFGGYLLSKEFDAVARVPEFPKELSIMQDGAILSLSGEKKLSIISRNNPVVRFQVGRVLPGQINHLVSQSGGEFRRPRFVNYYFDENNITEKFEKVRSMESEEPGKTQYTSFDLSEYMSVGGDSERKRGLFFFKVENWDPIRKRPLGVSDQRLILVTDLGLLVKEPHDGSKDVYVASIHTGAPLSGVLVEVVGKNGLPVLSVPTDGEGHAHFPPLSDFKNERQPVVYIARRGSDLSFIPYDWSDRHLNLSRFDVGGVVTPQAGAGMDAYLFSDRGIYRPGDEFRVGLIVKASDWKQSLAGVPLEVSISDPRGLEIYKSRISLSAAAFESIRFRTEESSPTGTYHVSVYIVKDGRRRGLLGDTGVRVEEFLPDRMRIATHLSTERADGWVSPDSLKGLVSLKNLFGTPAAKRKVSASITLSPAYPSFRGFADYSFFDPQHAKASFSDRLPDGETDNEGAAEFAFNLDRFQKATYRLVFSAEGFEAEGGRGVGSESSALVSSLDYLVGFKPDGDLRYINKESERSVRLVAVDPSLKKIAVSNLKIQWIEQRYVSSLIQQGGGTYKYESILKEIPIGVQDLKIPAEGMDYRLPTKLPGDFVLSIRGPDNVEYNRIGFSVVGRANLTRSLEKNAELQIKLNKADFAPGEEIELEIKAPYAGAGLITIEKDKVYAHKWFKSSTTASTQRIRVPGSIEGNGYVNVSFVRSMDSPEIFMSPLSYGVAPFSISRARRTNSVTLQSLDLAKPGEPYKIRYSTQKPGKIIVFAVDEGILQVAGYKTPDPLGHFFEKRALEVRTAQILDLILPEFKLVQSLSSPGGDQGRRALGKNLNPFRRKREVPVACWSGIMSSDSQSREFRCDIPDYFGGTLRVMAVAVSPDSLGVAEKRAIVRGPFVLTPNVPTFVAPGDEFTVSVGVANNISGSGTHPKIRLDLKNSAHVDVLDGSSRVLDIPENREGDATFRLRAKPSLGSANLTFTAVLGDQKSRYSVDLSVRPPVPYMTSLTMGYLKSSRADVASPRQMYPRYRTLEAAASPLPLGLARGLIHFLVKFPYGCTEQLISQSFPALILQHRPEFGYSPAKAHENFAAVLQILRARQNAEGAFGFYAANSHVSDFQTVYAMHFLTEARDYGFSVPPDLLSRGAAYLSDLSNRQEGSLDELRVRAYALYVLTRNGVVTTGFLNALRARLENGFPKVWKKDLAGIYVAATYGLLKQDSQAKSIIRSCRLGDPQGSNYDYYYDGLVRDSQLLYILSRHFPELLGQISGEELSRIVEPLTHGSYNTLSSAYTILALSAYADASGNPKPSTLSMSEIGPGGKAAPLSVSGGLFPKTEFSPQAKAVRFENKDGRLLFYQLTQAGFDMSLPVQEMKQKLEVQREFRDLKGGVITKIKMGEEAEVHLKIRALESDGFQNVAVVDLLPGGFDPVIKRQDASPEAASRQNYGGGEGEEGGAGSNPAEGGAWQPDYVDFREDRVVLYGAVSSSAREFVYRVKASSKGTFAIPPVFAESMYDRTIQARSLGGTMAVEGN